MSRNGFAIYTSPEELRALRSNQTRAPIEVLDQAGLSEAAKTAYRNFGRYALEAIKSARQARGDTRSPYQMTKEMLLGRICDPLIEYFEALGIPHLAHLAYTGGGLTAGLDIGLYMWETYAGIYGKDIATILISSNRDTQKFTVQTRKTLRYGRKLGLFDGRGVFITDDAINSGLNHFTVYRPLLSDFRKYRYRGLPVYACNNCIVDFEEPWKDLIFTAMMVPSQEHDEAYALELNRLLSRLDVSDAPETLIREEPELVHV